MIRYISIVRKDRWLDGCNRASEQKVPGCRGGLQYKEGRKDLLAGGLRVRWNRGALKV